MSNPIKISLAEKVTWVTPRGLWYLALILLSTVSGWSLLYFDPMIVMGVLGILLMVPILFYYPYVGVLAYLVFEYARIPVMFPALEPLQIGKLIVISTVVVWLLRSVITRKSKFVSDKVNWLMLLWLVLAFGSSFFAMDSKSAFAMTIVLTKWVVIYFLFINLVDTMPKWQWFMWLLLLLNFKMSQFQIRLFAAGYSMAGDQARFITQGVGVGSTAFFANATDFGAAMCVVVPFAVYLVRAVKSNVLKAGGVIFFSAFTISILQSGSRGATLALFVMAFFFWLKSSRKLSIGVLILFFAISFWASAPGAWKERFISTLEYRQDPTASLRIGFLKAGLKMFVERPLTGVGIDNFGRNYAAHYSEGRERARSWAPHSIFLQAGSELGLLGLLNLFAILYLIFKRNRETRMLYLEHKLKNVWIPNFAHALDLSLIGFIVAGAFLTILYYPHLYMIMILAISLNQITKKQRIANKNSVEENKK